MRRNEIAAAIHRRMCEDDRFGYSWEERYGATREVWTIGGEKVAIRVGDYDCSSSTITAWKLALAGTAYEGKLDGATYTGNMRGVFLKSGLFEWKPMSFDAQPGDLYLNEANHVAMCQQNDASADILSEFSGNEYGGAYGGRRGDQTGYEAHIGGYYDYPWDGILHYNGKADGYVKTTVKKSVPAQPRYRVRGVKNWGPWKSAGETAYAGNGIYDVDFSGLPPKSWWRLTLAGGEVLGKCKHNGTGKPVTGIEVYYETASPAKTGYWEAQYRVRAKQSGTWLRWEHDVQDGGAGGLGVIDCLQFRIAKC